MAACIGRPRMNDLDWAGCWRSDPWRRTTPCASAISRITLWNARPADRPELYDPRLRSRPLCLGSCLYLRRCRSASTSSRSPAGRSASCRAACSGLWAGVFHEGETRRAPHGRPGRADLAVPGRRCADPGRPRGHPRAGRRERGGVRRAWPASSRVLGRACRLGHGQRPALRGPLAEPEQGHDMHLPGAGRAGAEHQSARHPSPPPEFALDGAARPRSGRAPGTSAGSYPHLCRGASSGAPCNPPDSP